MPRLNDTNVPAMIQEHLQQGEKLKHWAFGVKQPNIFLLVLLIALAILPGVIAVVLLTKNYIVALTERRVLVLQCKGKLRVVDVAEFPLQPRPKGSGSVGPIFTHIRIDGGATPFVAKFHRLGMPNNREQSRAILAAVTGQPA